MNFSITKNGKPLDPKLYDVNIKSKTFSSSEDHLVLDFSDCYEWTFKTGNNCTFDTRWGCTFKTGDNCTFDTGDNCTFYTGCHCTFKTENNCTFKTGNNCTFNTGDSCVVVRRDVFEIIEIPENTTIKLNDSGVKGYEIIEELEIIKIGDLFYNKKEIEEKLKDLKPIN